VVGKNFLANSATRMWPTAEALACLWAVHFNRRACRDLGRRILLQPDARAMRVGSLRRTAMLLTVTGRLQAVIALPQRRPPACQAKFQLSTQPYLHRT
jgi:hypothetical protein